MALFYPLGRLSEKYFRLDPSFKFGLFLMLFAFITTGFTTQLSMLLSLIVLFYLSAIIAGPVRETLLTVLTNPEAKGSYMGFSRLGRALGGFTGYTGAGRLYDIAMEGFPYIT